MAFRIKARVSAILAVAACVAAAQDVTVRHRHLHKGAAGELRVSTDGISFVEKGKGSQHSRTWTFEDIQELELSPDTLRILTYEGRKWEPGRDREYLFDQLPPGFAKAVYAQWRDRLDQRFIADLADNDVAATWVIPAKRLGAMTGSQGSLAFGDDRIVYRSARPEQSRTWRFADVENIASAGPFDLAIVTHEREFRFQLKQALSESRYNELWRKVNRSKESAFLQSARH